MEIVEHVKNVDIFIKQSSKFLKKNGIMFIATLNQTLKSLYYPLMLLIKLLSQRPGMMLFGH